MLKYILSLFLDGPKKKLIKQINEARRNLIKAHQERAVWEARLIINPDDEIIFNSFITWNNLCHSTAKEIRYAERLVSTTK
jgi:hypothetical protein